MIILRFAKHVARLRISRCLANLLAPSLCPPGGVHTPIHIHVRRGDREAVFVVEPDVELRESVGFNVRELSRAEELIHDHLELIKQKWAEHLG